MNTLKYKATSVSATKELRALLEIELTNRGASWYHCLTRCLPYALFTSGEPEILFNPAGLTYYNLELTSIPEDPSLITGHTIPELIDTFLINEGVGIAIEARNPKQAIDISYGDLLGFHLYRTFGEPEDHLFKTNTPHASVIRQGIDILISAVPEDILPTTSLELLDAIVQHYGLEDARIKLIYLPETVQYELVFSIGNNQLTPRKKQALLQKLGWFLPRYYSCLICDLSTVELY
jgi:hypothetical protein